MFTRGYRRGANFMVILIGLVLMFKEEIGKIIDKAFKNIRDDSGKILK